MQKQKTSFLVGILLVLSFYTLGVYHVMAQSDNGLTTDITGQYSNPKYGIVNFEIPEGWHASEGMFGDKGISASLCILELPMNLFKNLPLVKLMRPYQ
jgi:hypothetical protein